MNLENIRKDINEIDDKMKDLFDARMECTKAVAKTKLDTGDSIYKPEREKEMYERFKDNPYHLDFLKKVVQISRRRQYELFLAEDTKVLREFVTSDLKGGKLELTLKTDEKSKKGLCIKDILSIISASKLDIERLEADGENDMVFVTFKVPEDEDLLKEAYLIKYMLEAETL